MTRSGTEPRVLGVWLNDADLAEACRRRADEIEMSYEEIDRIAGLAAGATSKVLSVPQAQGFGPQSRFLIPWALQMKFGLIEAPEYTREHVRRVSRYVRRGKGHHRNTKALALVQHWGREGARKMLENMGPEGISKQRRKAAKARWRKARRAMRKRPDLMEQVQI